MKRLILPDLALDDLGTLRMGVQRDALIRVARAVACTLLFLCLLAGDGLAQRYRGPADSAPRGSDTPLPSPSRWHGRGGASSGPQTPASVRATLERAGSDTRLRAEPDKTVWQFWWRHNRHAYLDLKTRLHVDDPGSASDAFFLSPGGKVDTWKLRKPSTRQATRLAIPALLDALRNARSPELGRASLLALARIAPPGAASVGPQSSPYPSVLEAYLSHGNEWLAETAAVALGILGDPGSVSTLASLMKDGQRGRELVSSVRVSLRVRACAAYGLGLIGNGNASSDVRREIAEHLMDVLTEPHFATRDLKVAAMIALGMTPVDWTLPAAGLRSDPSRPNYRYALSRRTQLEFLLDYFDPARARANKTSRHWFVRAHAPTAMARLCVGGPEGVRDRSAEMLLAAVAPGSGEQVEVQQGCVVALGILGDGDAQAGSVDDRIRTQLMGLTDRGEAQVKRFALIALAQSSSRAGQGRAPFAGRDAVRALLLEQVSGGPSPQRAWAALALGVMGHELQRQGQALAPSTLKTLRRACAENRRPSESGAHMLALGLLNDRASIDLLAERLEFFGGADGPRCSAAIALGLTGDATAVGALRAVMDDATHRPFLMESLGVGLALCGDEDVAPALARRLTRARGFGSQAPVALALAQVGDSRSVPVLVRALSDDSLSDWTRALIARALGSICDRESLPWTARISVGVHYRASTVTLTDEDGLGVLDYL
ncbi:MAG: HEAT repeat protein [Chlamydiales bacterium]|jgi:HEAT repeat protein